MAFRIETVGDYAFQVVDTASPTPPLMYLPRQGTWYEEQTLQVGFVKFYGTSGTNEDNIKLYSRFDNDFKGFALGQCVDGNNSDAPFTDATFRTWVGANLVGFNTGGSTPSPTPELENRVVVTQDNYTTTLLNIDSAKEYFIDGVVDVSDFSIVPPTDSNGMLLVGYDFDVSKLISSEDNFTLIQSSVGGSGNIKMRDLAIEITGSNSQVYDLTPIDNFRAIEINRVNKRNSLRR